MKNKMWSLALCTPLFVLLHIPTNKTKLFFVFKYVRNSMQTLYCSLNACRKVRGGGL